MPSYTICFKVGDSKRSQRKKIWAESATDAETAVKKVLPKEAVIIDVGREHDIPAEGVIRSY